MEVEFAKKKTWTLFRHVLLVARHIFIVLIRHVYA
jgi:hypothetical protein